MTLPRSTCLRYLALAALILMLGACASRSTPRNALVGAVLPAPDTTSSSGAYEGGSDYRIGAQDLIEVSVFGIEDLSRSVRVNSNGQISLPLIGGVMAAPFGAWIAKRVNPDRLLAFVGALVTLTSGYGLYRVFG